MKFTLPALPGQVGAIAAYAPMCDALAREARKCGEPGGILVPRFDPLGAGDTIPVAGEPPYMGAVAGVAFTQFYDDQPILDFLAGLTKVARPVSVGVIAARGPLLMELACTTDDWPIVRAVTEAVSGIVVRRKFSSLPDVEWVAYETRWEGPYARPVTSVGTKPALLAALGVLRRLEVGIVHVLVQPLPACWGGNLRAWMAMHANLASLGLAPAPSKATLALVEKKAAMQLFAVTLRVAAATEAGAQLLRARVAGLRHGDRDVAWERVSAQRIRQFRPEFTGGIVSTDELQQLLAFPTREDVRRYDLAPAAPLAREGILLGYAGGVPVRLPVASLTKHVLVVGQQGTGKSTALTHLILQAINQSAAVVVLDPHGKLVDDVMSAVPTERAKDVFYVTPSLERRALAFNPFVSSAGDAGKRASDLVFAFRNISGGSWGPRLERLLLALITALLLTPGSCLSDLLRLLSPNDDSFRRHVMSRDVPAELRRFFAEDLPMYLRTPAATDPLRNRLTKFLLDEHLAAIFSSPDHRLDFGRVLGERQVLLARISISDLGIDGASLLGTFFISQLLSTVLSRGGKGPPIYLFIDEFHRFHSSTLEVVLREGRKFLLGSVLASQFLAGIDPETIAALENAATTICFDLVLDDALRMSRRLPGIKADDLQNNGVGVAVARVGTDVVRLRVPPPLDVNTGQADQIIKQSLAAFYRPVTSPPGVTSTTHPQPLWDEI